MEKAPVSPSNPLRAAPVRPQDSGPRRPLCTEGMLIKGQWKISKQLGMGSFGEIYLAININTLEKVAIKVEIQDEKKQALRAEVIIMRKLQSCPCVGKFIACGRQDKFNFLVMQLFGENLAEMRRRQPLCAFSLPTVCRLAIEMVQALHSMHSHGIVHRDVKPSNFVLDKSYTSPDYSVHTEDRVYLYIIDFGLSRKYLDSNGEVRPPRQNAGFRGTARYASIYSHASKDLAPRDDLWSVFYMLVEFVLGSLPWSKVRDRDKIGEIKNQYIGNTKLVDKLPGEFAEFQRYLMTLDYFSVPDYELIIRFFRGLLRKTTGQSALPPYEWENVRMRSTSQRMPPPPPALLHTGPPPATATTTAAAAAAGAQGQSHQASASSKKKKSYNEEPLGQMKRKSSMCEGHSDARAPTTFAAHVMSSTAIASSEKKDADKSGDGSSTSDTNNNSKEIGSKKEKTKGHKKKKDDCIIV